MPDFAAAIKPVPPYKSIKVQPATNSAVRLVKFVNSALDESEPDLRDKQEAGSVSGEDIFPACSVAAITEEDPRSKKKYLTFCFLKRMKGMYIPALAINASGITSDVDIEVINYRTSFKKLA